MAPHLFGLMIERVVIKAEPCKRLDDLIGRAFLVARGVSVFDSQNELAAAVAGIEPGKNGASVSAGMGGDRRTWSKASNDVLSLCHKATVANKGFFSELTLLLNCDIIGEN